MNPDLFQPIRLGDLQLRSRIPPSVKRVTLSVCVQANFQRSPIMLPCPMRDLEQNSQSHRWFAKAAENQPIPVANVQNLCEFSHDFLGSWFFGEFKVETAYAAPETFQAEVAGIRAPIGYVQVKCVVQPVNGSWFVINQCFHQ